MTVRGPHTLLLGILGLGGLFRAPAASAQEPLSPGKDAPASLVAVPSDVPADARRYAVLIAGNRAGVLAAWVSPDGVHHSFFAFNDRGRGPRITTRVVLDPTGVITELDATGNDYLKAPVNERFRLAGGKASWSSDAEKGEKRLTAPALYAPMSGTLDRRNRGGAPGGAGPPPATSPGRRGVDRCASPSRRSTSEGAPSRRSSTRKPVSASRPAPSGSTRTAGSSRRAATGGRSYARARKPAWPALLKAQKARESARGEELARKLEKNLAAPLLVRHARLFDSEAASVRDGMSVRVVRGRIAAVGPDSSVIASAGDEVLDARGRMLLPGLWDMHVHVGDWDDGLLHIAAGVTTVRDMANDIDHLQDLASRFDSGALIGPARPQGGIHRRARTVSGAHEGLRRHAGGGARPTSTATPRSATCRSRSTARSSRSSFRSSPQRRTPTGCA